MARNDEPIRRMTLGSMRWLGVRGLFVTCAHCGHERAVSMDGWLTTLAGSLVRRLC
jgi:hypothetical protein